MAKSLVKSPTDVVTAACCCRSPCLFLFSVARVAARRAEIKSLANLLDIYFGFLFSVKHEFFDGSSN
jgi:hypothetical protein